MTPDAFERLRERLAHVDADQGWFFARVAEQVAEQRKALGLSQKELAELTGTTQSAIARLESGGRPPRIDTLLRIAEALDCELVVELRPRTRPNGVEMSARVEVEDVQTTKGEKLLAVVLTVFLLIGGIWAYQKIDDAVRSTTPPDFSYRGTPAEQAAIAQLEGANAGLRRAERAAARARENLEFRREAYRTALDEGRRPLNCERPTNRSQRRLAQAERERRAAAQAVAEAQPSALAAQRKIAEVQQGRSERRELLAFVFRLAFVLATVAFGVLAPGTAAATRLPLLRGRDRSRGVCRDPRLRSGGRLPHGLLRAARPRAARPLTVRDRRDPARLRRAPAVPGAPVPQWRVRKGECPFCGYPVRENEHCEGCGRT